MGLDMYLKAEVSKYVSYYDDGNENYGKGLYPDFLRDFEDMQRERRNLICVSSEYEIGYWRKFNALHSYIVNSFADGVDECQDIVLWEQDIKRILETLKSLTPENASVVMPPKDGFFFGSTDIDEWYWRDVGYSIKVFEKILKVVTEFASKAPGSYLRIIYHASW